MESLIDQRYRLDLVARYLEGYEEASMAQNKAKFFCPLCQSSRKRDKYQQKKGACFWNSTSNSWRFNCMKCHPKGIGMFNYLSKLDSGLASAYQLERWQSGTTGWGHDCPSPVFAKVAPHSSAPSSCP
jgi:hypothetical protein